MAEKPDKKAENTAPPAGERKDSARPQAGLLGKTPILIGGVMLLEAVVLFGGFKFLGGAGPHSAGAADLTIADSAKAEGATGKAPAADKKKNVELAVVELRAPNRLSGRTFLYDVRVCALVKADKLEQVKDAIKEREALITDRVRTIIASCDPEKLGGGSEPGLETLRRQIKHQLDEIVGEAMVEEVLIPKCIPFRTDF